MREPWWLQFLKFAFLEMPIVKIWLVFQNQVTYDVWMHIKMTLSLIQLHMLIPKFHFIVVLLN